MVIVFWSATAVTGVSTPALCFMPHPCINTRRPADRALIPSLRSSVLNVQVPVPGPCSAAS